MAGFHLNEEPRIVKTTEAESSMVVSQASEGTRSYCLMHVFSIFQVGNTVTIEGGHDTV